MAKYVDRRFVGVRRNQLLLAGTTVAVLAGVVWMVTRHAATVETPAAPVASTIAPPPAVSAETPGETKAVPSPTPVAVNPEIERKARLQTLEQALGAAMKARDGAETEKLSGEILALEPRDGPAWTAAGVAAQQKGNVDEARKAYDTAIEISPERAINYFLRGRLSRQTGDQAAARKDLEAASKIDANDVLIANTLMIVKVEAGDTQEMRGFLQSAKSLGITSGAQTWVVGAAALSLQDGRTHEAAVLLKNARGVMPPEILAELLSDKFFTPYSGDPELRPIFFPGSN